MPSSRQPSWGVALVPVAVVALAASLLVPGLPGRPVRSGDCRDVQHLAVHVAFTGRQSWTVPAGVSSITITAVGAAGGSDTNQTQTSSGEASLTGTFAVGSGALVPAGGTLTRPRRRTGRLRSLMLLCGWRRRWRLVVWTGTGSALAGGTGTLGQCPDRRRWRWRHVR